MVEINLVLDDRALEATDKKVRGFAFIHRQKPG